MPLLLAGVDEAGYGPMLGPLCVGMTLFSVRDWSPGERAPDLWRLLKTGVCRKPSDRSKRVPIADSKELKLANDCKTNHPLVHLERGVLAFLRCLESAPESDADLMTCLGASLAEQPWYGGEPMRLPVALTPGGVGIAAGRIAAALERAGVELLDARCVIVTEGMLNDVVRRTGSKAEATALAVGEHLRRVAARWSATPKSGAPTERELESVGAGSAAAVGALAGNEASASNLDAGPVETAQSASTPDAPTLALRIVCDQLGGRTQYQNLLARELPGAEVVPLTESGERSRYAIGPEAVVQFMPEAETAHLPVALASMIAKFVRELSMMRFNRYWCGRQPELKPTAGYSQDSRRWLEDVRELLRPEERASMVRIA